MAALRREQAAQTAAQAAEHQAEIAAAQADIAELQKERGSQQAHNDHLASLLAAEQEAATRAAKSYAEEWAVKMGKLDEAANASRRETGWSWSAVVDHNGRHGYSVAGLAPGIENPAALGAPLVAICYGESSGLSTWDVIAHEAGSRRRANVGFDGDDAQPEDLQGIGNALLAFADLRLPDLWAAETLYVEMNNLEGETRSATFDTAQLKRMFPSVDAFCNGQRPAAP